LIEGFTVISKSAMYALRATVELARLPDGAFATAAQVAEACGAPPKYLCKVLEVLVGRGLIRSQKGLHGGYALTRPAAEITLFEIVDPIDQLGRPRECFLGWPQCTDESPCAAHGRWRHVCNALTEMLTTTKVTELLPKAKRFQPSQRKEE
jgi:Rrf2 family protein